MFGAGFGLLSFLGKDAHEFALQILHRLHLDPSHHYPHVFLELMVEVTDIRLWMFAGLAAFYSTIRFVEAYGLWHERRWAEWLAALSGGVYVPVELYEIIRHATWLKFTMLGLNLLIVGYMVWLLTEQRRTTATRKDAGSATLPP